MAIDDIVCPPGDLCFVLRGQWIAVEHMPTVSDIWWYMRKVAEIYVRSTGVAPGSHYVDVTFDLSLQMHTPTIDRNGLWPTLQQSLTAHLPAEAL